MDGVRGLEQEDQMEKRREEKYDVRNMERGS